MLPLVALFLVARLLMPTMAALVVLVAGALLAIALGLVKPLPSLGLSQPELVVPAWDVATLIGLGVPLYLVTMRRRTCQASPCCAPQATGRPPSRCSPSLVRHRWPRPSSARTPPIWRQSRPPSAPGRKRIPIRRSAGRRGVFYALWWALVALFGASLVGLFAALPPALLATVAGLALLGSMASAMGAALVAEKERLAAAGTLAVTASGVTLMGVARPSGASSSACSSWPWTAS